MQENTLAAGYLPVPAGRLSFRCLRSLYTHAYSICPACILVLTFNFTHARTQITHTYIYIYILGNINTHI